MHAHPGLRDAVAAVLLIHPVLNDAWIEENFTHETFDVEANQALPSFGICQNKPIPALHSRHLGFPQLDGAPLR